MVDESEEKKLRISVGYALPQKKINSFITASLVTHAKEHGVDLVPIDPNKPLYLQPTFHCLIHKLYSHDWNRQLLDFQSKYPNVPIIDHPSSINRLHNRVTMLDFIPHLTLPSDSPTVGIPHQILLQDDSNLSLQFPVIAKPLVAYGTPDSHQLSLVFNSMGLQKVRQQAPLVLQEFVNHGGVLFKVYVAGDHVKCVQRNSLPDLTNLQTEQVQEGVLPVSRISNLPTTSSAESSEQEQENISMPPLDFVHNLATAIREATQLHLFNFDLIRDASQTDGNRYLIVDVNYFPGYAKFSGFEAMLTDFFLDVVHKHATT